MREDLRRETLYEEERLTQLREDRLELDLIRKTEEDKLVQIHTVASLGS